MIKKLNYTFNDESLLDLALTQSGVDAVNYNERLEFIGDRVLGLSVAGLLFDMFPTEAEGDLARRHPMLVSTETLAQVACELGLDKMVRHGHMTAGRVKHVLADAMEAVFAAVYLDGGVEEARSLIHRVLLDKEREEVVEERRRDYKTALQELVQRTPGNTITFSVNPYELKCFKVEY